jgi:beta-glucosidase
MRLKILCLLVVLNAWFAPSAVFGDDEVCVACDKKIIVSGDFSHRRVWGVTTIEGATWRGEEAFREEIYGTNFTLSISGLPAGKYVTVIGLVEVDYTDAGQRVFDITCGSQVLASNLDILAKAGKVGKVLLLTNQVEHADGTVSGPLVFAFTGRVGPAKLNSFELRDDAGLSLIYLRTADLINVEDAAALKPPVAEGPEIWKDASQPMDARVKDLVRRMSLAEKVEQMRNAAPAIPRLGVPAYDYWNECLHGVARAGIATVFPQAIGMAATWDTPLIHQEADVIATEARAKNNRYRELHDGDSAQNCGLTFWTPNINIFRDPRWGRGQETYGEDPFLTARLGVAFIRGLQGDDPKYIKAMACAKHYAVHSGPESLRHGFDAEPPERDFYETYLPHFEAAVREGHVGAVMGSYNAVYGKPACASPLLLTDLLRKQWSFDGHVVSDCGAIFDIFGNHHFAASPEEAAADAVKAGDDLCCGTDYNSLTRAVKEGLISEAEIDIALGYVLKARFQLGLFDPPSMVPYAEIPFSENNSPEHEALALKVARESMVLLKNDGLLPLDRAKIKRIAVIGANASSVPMLLGNYNGQPANPVTILDGIQSVAGKNIEVTYEPGCPLTMENSADEASAEMWARAIESAEAADVVIYVGGINSQLEGEEMPVHIDGFEGGDRTRIELPVVQEKLLKVLQATGKPVVFVNCSGSAMAIPWEAANLPAILQAWYPGEQGGRAVAEVLFGDVNPAGRLPVTFYRSTADLPAFEDYSMSNRTYRYFNGQPLFAFGHGLSYTKFDYSNPGLDEPFYSPNGMMKVSFTLKNSGAHAGDEVAQVYFRHVNSTLPQPKLALCGFVRVHLEPGQRVNVTVNVPVERFRYWDTIKKQYAVEPGDYELLVGGASDDIRLRAAFKIVGQ